MKYRETQWAEMKPDTYAGDSCDEIKPRWEGYAEGDKGDPDTFDPMTLAARTFPPGTRVTVEVPVCPQCEMWDADYALNHQTGEMGKCECGFDWQEWTRDTYA